MVNHRRRSPRAKLERTQTGERQGKRPEQPRAGEDVPNVPAGEALPEFAYRRTYRLNRRFTVEFCLNGKQLDVLWEPFLPNGRKRNSLIPGYRNARDHFLASLGVNIAVIEL